MAGLRTNALVALGAAAFVILGMLTPDEISPTRVAAQVVSGIGFLCAGVIMRDGLNVRGLNTAATLWCSAAVGTLAGMNFLLEATIVALLVIATNTLLRPIVKRLKQEPISEQTEVETRYHLYVSCRTSAEAHIRALLLHMITVSPLEMRGLNSIRVADEQKAEVEAQLVGIGAQNKFLEQVVSRLSLEDSVNQVSWTLEENKATGPLNLHAS